MRTLALTLLLLCCPRPLYAQVEQQPEAWAPEHQAFADKLGTAMVAGQMAADVVKAVRDARHDSSPRPLLHLGCRGGLAFGIAQTLKLTIREPRPNGVDDRSFPSMHTAFLFAHAGWSWTFGLPLAAVGGESRVWANWHHPRDVLAGAALGALAQALCR